MTCYLDLEAPVVVSDDMCSNRLDGFWIGLHPAHPVSLLED